jgi:hypothetical protein
MEARATRYRRDLLRAVSDEILERLSVAVPRTVSG